MGAGFDPMRSTLRLASASSGSAAVQRNARSSRPVRLSTSRTASTCLGCPQWDAAESASCSPVEVETERKPSRPPESACWYCAGESVRQRLQAQTPWNRHRAMPSTRPKCAPSTKPLRTDVSNPDVGVVLALGDGAWLTNGRAGRRRWLRRTGSAGRSRRCTGP